MAVNSRFLLSPDIYVLEGRIMSVTGLGGPPTAAIVTVCLANHTPHSALGKAFLILDAFNPYLRRIIAFANIHPLPFDNSTLPMVYGELIVPEISDKSVRVAPSNVTISLPPQTRPVDMDDGKYNVALTLDYNNTIFDTPLREGSYNERKI